MQVPVYGSSAYQYDYDRYREAERKVVRKVKVRKKKKINMRNVALVGIALFLAFGLLFRSALILEQSSEIEKLEKELAGVNAQVVSGTFAIERDMDLGKIEAEAINRLGMQRPTKEQTVYVHMANEDYAETPGRTTEKKNIFTAVAESISEYFG